MPADPDDMYHGPFPTAGPGVPGDRWRRFREAVWIIGALLRQASGALAFLGAVALAFYLAVRFVKWSWK